MKKDAFDSIFADKQRVMVIMPHPDDTELYCGGTVARLIKNGKDVRMIKMTNGGKGTKQSSRSESELSQVRSKEDFLAAQKLGLRAENNNQLDIPDGEVENDIQTIEKVSYHVRQFRPHLIITCNPEDVIIRFGKDANWVNHRDHRNTARVAIDSAYPYSRDRAFFPDQLSQLTTEFTPTTFYLLADYYDHIDEQYIDISEYVAIKTSAWQCHESAYTKQGVIDAIEYLNKDEKNYYEAFRYIVAD